MFVLFWTMGQTSVHAITIVGGKLVATSDSEAVTVTYVGSSASYEDQLSLYSPFGQLLFDNKTTPNGTVVNLGTFNTSTELIFKLVDLVQGYSFYSGPASRNIDNFFHESITDLGGNIWQIGWEDLYGGGDQDFNDLTIRVSSVRGVAPGDPIVPNVPEPATLTLVGLGLLTLNRLRMTKKLRHP